MDFKDILNFMLFCAAFILVILLAIFGVSAMVYYGGTKPACEQYARLNNAEISTQFFGNGCLVKYEGRWVDYDVAIRNKQEIKVSN